MKKLKELMWDRMPVWGRWIFYPILLFMITMIVWGQQIYEYFGWR